METKRLEIWYYDSTGHPLESESGYYYSIDGNEARGPYPTAEDAEATAAAKMGIYAAAQLEREAKNGR